MIAHVLAPLLSVLLLAILCTPPVLAILMLFSRLRGARPAARPFYLVSCVAAVLVLLFNALVSLNILGPVRALAPSILVESPGLTALLFAWTAAGLCVLLQVVDPQRQRRPQI